MHVPIVTVTHLYIYSMDAELFSVLLYYIAIVNKRFKCIVFRMPCTKAGSLKAIQFNHIKAWPSVV